MMRITCDSSYAAPDFPTLSDSKSSANIIVSSVGTNFQILHKQAEQLWSQDRVFNNPGHNVLLWQKHTMYFFSLFSNIQVAFKSKVSLIFYAMTTLL